MRLLFAALLAAAALAGGCSGLPQTPYDGSLSCTSIGGTYTADGRCLAGNT